MYILSNQIHHWNNFGMIVFEILSIWISVCVGQSSMAGGSTYLLPKGVTPIHYTVRMSPNLNDSTFTGSVMIKIAVEEPIDEIILHQKGLNITISNIKLTLIGNFDEKIVITAAGKFGTIDQEFYKISLEKTLTVDGYVLSILNFQGSLEQNFIGFYLDSYVDQNSNTFLPYAVTNFQPTFARYAFPCFDEPALKAIFKVHIIRPKKYFSISNNPLKTTTKIDNNLVEDEFEESERMSTYSLSFLVSQLQQSRTIGVNTAIIKKEYLSKGEEHYFLHLADRFVLCYEKLLLEKYNLQTIQHVALVSFYNLDMEAWGFIVHHEIMMLSLNDSITNLKQQMTITLAHKICHQWFGNLVSVKWWNYTWLNEGYCVYSSYVVVDMLNPKWNVTQNLLTHETNHIMMFDYLKSVQPLTHSVETPEEIIDIFNLISYSKGAAVIRMLEAIVSPYNFRMGIIMYIDTYGFDATEPNDLYDAIQETLNRKTKKLLGKLTISEVMSTWDSQSGFPLVNVKRNYDNGDGMRYVTFSQQKFTLNAAEFSKSIWTIPINYITSSYPSIETTPTNWLKHKTITVDIKNLTKSDWLIVNVEQAYYYRVNYDTTNWMMIINALKENLRSINQLNRIQLIHDSFAFASMGLIDLSIPFGIAETFKKETEYGALRALRITLDNMEKRVAGTRAEQLLQSFIADVINKIYDHYNSQTKKKKVLLKHKDKLISELTFSWLFQLNDHKSKDDALFMYNNWRRGEALPDYLEKHIMCSVVKNSNEKRWEFLFTKYNATDNPILKENIFYALGCTTNKRLLKRFLDFTDKNEYYNIISALRSIMARGTTGLDIVLKYTSINFEILYATLGKNNINEILIDVGSRITAQTHLNQLRGLSSSYSQQHTLFDLAIEKAEENIQWNKNHLNNLIEYLDKYERGTTMCYLPFNTLLVICVTLLLKF